MTCHFTSSRDHDVWENRCKNGREGGGGTVLSGRDEHMRRIDTWWWSATRRVRSSGCYWLGVTALAVAAGFGVTAGRSVAPIGRIGVSVFFGAVRERCVSRVLTDSCGVTVTRGAARRNRSGTKAPAAPIREEANHFPHFFKCLCPSCTVLQLQVCSSVFVLSCLAFGLFTFCKEVGSYVHFCPCPCFEHLSVDQPIDTKGPHST